MRVTVGTRLLARSGTWIHAAVTSTAYQWQRGDEWGTEASFSNIAGQTGSTYEVVSADKEKTLRCLVTATNPFGSGTLRTQNFIVADGRTDFARCFGYGPGRVRANESVIACLPAITALSPCLIHIHGGGYSQQPEAEEPAPGEKTEPTPSAAVEKMTAYQSAGIANFREKGWAQFIVNFPQDYDFATGTPGYLLEQPAILQALQWVKANAELSNGDPSKVCIIGGSSGASLALMAACKLNERKPGYVKAVVSLSGLTDLNTRVKDALAARKVAEEKGETSSVNALNTRIENNANYAGLDVTKMKTPGYLDGEPLAQALLQSLSPYTHLGATMPYCSLYSSTGESPNNTPPNQAAILKAAAEALGLGARVEYEERANGHSYEYFSSVVQNKADTFLKAHL